MQIELNNQPVLMNPEETVMQTILVMKDGKLVSAWGNKTVEELQTENPLLKQMPFGEAVKLIDMNLAKRYDTLWEEIPENIWWEMLEFLPPESWGNITLPHSKGYDVYEMFRMSEYREGEYTEHFARVGERYFSKICSSNIPIELHAQELQRQLQND